MRGSGRAHPVMRASWRYSSSISASPARCSAKCSQDGRVERAHRRRERIAADPTTVHARVAPSSVIVKGSGQITESRSELGSRLPPRRVRSPMRRCRARLRRSGSLAARSRRCVEGAHPAVRAAHEVALHQGLGVVVLTDRHLHGCLECRAGTAQPDRRGDPCESGRFADADIGCRCAEYPPCARCRADGR